MKLTKRSKLGLVVVAAGLVLAGGIYYALEQSGKDKNNNSQTPPSGNATEDKPAASSVAADPLKYADKTLEIKGLLRQAPNGQYILMEENPDTTKPAGGIAVDFETNKIDALKHLGETPVTLKGKMVKTETLESLTVNFVVESVNP